jgi:hypothetical protein
MLIYLNILTRIDLVPIFLLNITKTRKDECGLFGGGFQLSRIAVPWLLPRSPLLMGNAEFLVPDIPLLEACGWPPVACLFGGCAGRGESLKT